MASASTRHFATGKCAEQALEQCARKLVDLIYSRSEAEAVSPSDYEPKPSTSDCGDETEAINSLMNGKLWPKRARALMT